MGNLFREDNEILTGKSPFSSYSNEKLCIESKPEKIPLEYLMMNIARGGILSEDFLILKGLEVLQFATSRMISQYLQYVKNFSQPQEKTSNRLKFMLKNDLVARYAFHSNVGKIDTRAYFLQRAGNYLLMSRNYQSSWKPTDKAKLIDDIKEILCRNQVLLKFLSSCTNIKEYKIFPEIRTSCGIPLKPHLRLTLNNNGSNDVIFFEAIRSYDGWEEKLDNKLFLYNDYYNKFIPSPDCLEPPQLIFIGETDVHNGKIYKHLLLNKISLKGIEFLFTNDIRVLERNCDNLFYRFSIIQETNKPKIIINELSYSNINTNTV